MSVSQTVWNIVEPIIEKLNIELIDVEYVKEGSSWYLRLYIDKEGGVSLDDCQMVNDSVSDAIDEADPISGAYIFEVSSPGLDRPLKTDRDFKRYKGELVEVGLYAPKNGIKSCEGYLESRQDGILTIKNENGEEMTFDVQDVAVVKRAIKF